MYENKFTTVDFEIHKRKFAGVLKEILGVTFWPYNKSFIDQPCSIKMAGYWPHFFFFFFLRFYKYPAILTSRLVNNALTIIIELDGLD